MTFRTWRKPARLAPEVVFGVIASAVGESEEVVMMEIVPEVQEVLAD